MDVLPRNGAAMLELNSRTPLPLFFCWRSIWSTKLDKAACAFVYISLYGNWRAQTMLLEEGGWQLKIFSYGWLGHLWEEERDHLRYFLLALSFSGGSSPAIWYCRSVQLLWTWLGIITGLLGFNTVSSTQVQNHLQAAEGELGGSCCDGRMLLCTQGPKADIEAPAGLDGGWSVCGYLQQVLPAAESFPGTFRRTGVDRSLSSPGFGVLCEHRWFPPSSRQNYSSSPVSLTHVLAGFGKCKKKNTGKVST